MRLIEVLKPQLKRMLLEGQADRLVEDALSSIRNALSHVGKVRSDLMGIYDWWERHKDAVQELPTTWRIIVAKLVVTASFFKIHEVLIGTIAEDSEEYRWLSNKLDKKRNDFMISPTFNLVTFVHVHNVVNTLQHYSGIQYPPIQNFNPLTKNYRYFEDFEDDLAELEKEYIEKKEESKRLLTPAGVEILNLGDFSWYDLEVGQCRIEADAMGHCGNAGAMDGDTILSLRETKIVDGTEYHVPHLTFVQNNGYLGEMKGRANQKPSQKYHDHIVELLKQPFIRGIVGGGYMEQNNFHLNDLRPDQLEEVRQVKGDEFIKREGDVTQRYDNFFNDIEQLYGQTDDHNELDSELIHQFNEYLTENDVGVGHIDIDGTVDVPRTDTWDHFADYALGESFIEQNPLSIKDQHYPGNYSNFVVEYLPFQARNSIVGHIKSYEMLKQYYDEDEMSDDQFIIENLDEIIEELNPEFDSIANALEELNDRAEEQGVELEIYRAMENSLNNLVAEYRLKQVPLSEALVERSRSIKSVVEVPVNPSTLREYFEALIANEDEFELSIDEPYTGFRGYDKEVIKDAWEDVFFEHGILMEGDDQ